MCSQNRGRGGGLLPSDRATRTVTAVTVRETDADLMAAGPAAAYRQVLGLLLGVAPGAEVHETYEVSVRR